MWVGGYQCTLMCLRPCLAGLGWERDRACWPLIYHCHLTPIHSNTYVHAQPDRHDGTPSAPAERTILAFWQLIKSVASFLQRPSSLLLTGELFHTAYHVTSPWPSPLHSLPSTAVPYIGWWQTLWPVSPNCGGSVQHGCTYSLKDTDFD